MIVEGGGRVEVIESDAAGIDETASAPMTLSQAVDGIAVAEDGPSHSPCSAELALHTPQSYMSATGALLTAPFRFEVYLHHCAVASA